MSSHVSGVGAPLAAFHAPSAAPLLGIVPSRAVPRMIHRIPSSPLFAVGLRPFLCPSPRGGGAIRRERHMTSSHRAQDAQAQADQQKTCHDVQAPFRATCSRCCIWPRNIAAVDVEGGHRHVRQGGEGISYGPQASLLRMRGREPPCPQGTMPELLLLTSLSTSIPKSGAAHGDTPCWEKTRLCFMVARSG